MLHNLKKRTEGFTIIEVLIVLAIAGLILLVVFLAVPALQRNSRNTQRKSDAAHLTALISEWESNNSGSTPSKVVVLAATTPAAGEIDAKSEKFSIIDTSADFAIAANSGTLPTAPAADKIVVLSKATCSGNLPSTTVGTTRSIAVWYGLEGGTATGCVQV